MVTNSKRSPQEIVKQYSMSWSGSWLIFFMITAVFGVVDAERTKLTWVNGIAHNLGHMESGQQEISKFFGGKPVEYCHNPTSMSSEEDFMGYVGDLTQAGTQKLGRITGEVNELVKHLKEAVAKVGKKGRVIHIAHSQGALLTSLASRQLTPLEMNQIEVIAFGGAAALKRTSLTPWGRVVNYYSINDPLLLVVPPAASALRSGFVGDDEFCFLAPRIGDPIRDHNLLGPTYAQALAWEGRRFQQTYQNVLQRMQRPLYLFLLALYHATLVRLGQAILAAIQLIAAPIQAAYWALHAQLMKLVIRPLASFIVLLARIIQEMIQKARNREQYQSAKIALEMVESNRRSHK